MSLRELEEILRDFNLGDFLLVEGYPNKIFKVHDIFDNSSRRDPSSDYELVVIQINSKKELYITKEKAIRLSEDQQRLSKLIYD